MRPILITDPGDPQIAAFREVRERDLVGRQGRFVAEGEVVLRALLSDASRHEAEAVLIAESRWPRPDRDDIALAVVGVGNHDNMGGLFRAAAGFGARGVLLDPGCCDPLYRKAIRVSVGAALTTPFARLESGADIAEVLIGLGYQPLALSPEGGERLADLRRDGPAAVVVGAEGPGLSETLMARCRRVSIPMATGWDSLNVATAAAIALHQLRFAAPS